MNTTVPVPAHENNRLSILIVEDDETQSAMLKKILESHAGEIWFVWVAKNLEHARHSALMVRFDLVISDNRLPDGRGINFLDWLARAFPRTFRCHISANFRPTADQKRKHHFHKKPLAMEEIQLIVARARRHKARTH